ncbi:MULTISPECIES: ACT domain-containing protein [Chryseobacterium]|jgi:acetolactate synthase-1/3 small subunit|uniref:acetolactate synthase n=1 Tax=Chryseobacterium rhizosphaerae TaxID=395937 RepID=A0AAE3Y8R3_9FLAO|nr:MULTISPECIES: ACT domain-containing protein [Chryseobacterium]MBL3546333.1 ACT domain-containing protein [Chryseobacterium sp. KMC2]MDC8101088.1 ACT domain-containing protein [Chryseobacterium rhizosphaerae]MDR6526122.1 acetolactate synthase-1/3 small subunit [Chryseobacterium rhizosphaerae]MDR6545304.1 acetolactate synthase-1/3 small subunit [Chryseobacterium rhizosphaerae]REC75746.1 ACT domain-containing protein [Chryseobacterium rhizosphaerae]
MKTEHKEYTITAYTEDYLGLISRINAIFSRRRISMVTFNVGPSEIERVKKFVIVIKETEESVQKITRQVEKQVDVLEVHYHRNPHLSVIEYAS